MVKRCFLFSVVFISLFTGVNANSATDNSSSTEYSGFVDLFTLPSLQPSVPTVQPVPTPLVSYPTELSVAGPPHAITHQTDLYPSSEIQDGSGDTGSFITIASSSTAAESELGFAWTLFNMLHLTNTNQPKASVSSSEVQFTPPVKQTDRTWQHSSNIQPSSQDGDIIPSSKQTANSFYTNNYIFSLFQSILLGSTQTSSPSASTPLMSIPIADVSAIVTSPATLSSHPSITPSSSEIDSLSTIISPLFEPATRTVPTFPDSLSVSFVLTTPIAEFQFHSITPSVPRSTVDIIGQINTEDTEATKSMRTWQMTRANEFLASMNTETMESRSTEVVRTGTESVSGMNTDRLGSLNSKAGIITTQPITSMTSLSSLSSDTAMEEYFKTVITDPTNSAWSQSVQIVNTESVKPSHFGSVQITHTDSLLGLNIQSVQIENPGSGLPKLEASSLEKPSNSGSVWITNTEPSTNLKTHSFQTENIDSGLSTLVTSGFEEPSYFRSAWITNTEPLTNLKTHSFQTENIDSGLSMLVTSGFEESYFGSAWITNTEPLSNLKTQSVQTENIESGLSMPMTSSFKESYFGSAWITNTEPLSNLKTQSVQTENIESGLSMPMTSIFKESYFGSAWITNTEPLSNLKTQSVQTENIESGLSMPMTSSFEESSYFRSVWITNTEPLTDLKTQSVQAENIEIGFPMLVISSSSEDSLVKDSRLGVWLTPIVNEASPEFQDAVSNVPSSQTVSILPTSRDTEDLWISEQTTNRNGKHTMMSQYLSSWKSLDAPFTQTSYSHQAASRSSQVLEQSISHTSLSSPPTTNILDLQPSPSTVQGIRSADVSAQASSGLQYLTTSEPTSPLPVTGLSHTLNVVSEHQKDFFNTSTPSLSSGFNGNSWTGIGREAPHLTTTEVPDEYFNAALNGSISTPETVLFNISQSSLPTHVPIDSALAVSGSAMLDHTPPPPLVSQLGPSSAALMSTSPGEWFIKRSGVTETQIISTGYSSVVSDNPDSMTNPALWMNSSLTTNTNMHLRNRSTTVSSSQLSIIFPSHLLPIASSANANFGFADIQSSMSKSDVFPSGNSGVPLLSAGSELLQTSAPVFLPTVVKSWQDVKMTSMNSMFPDDIVETANQQSGLMDTMSTRRFAQDQISPSEMSSAFQLLPTSMTETVFESASVNVSSDSAFMSTTVPLFIDYFTIMPTPVIVSTSLNASVSSGTSLLTSQDMVTSKVEISSLLPSDNLTSSSHSFVTAISEEGSIYQGMQSKLMPRNISSETIQFDGDSVSAATMPEDLSSETTVPYLSGQEEVSSLSPLDPTHTVEEETNLFPTAIRSHTENVSMDFFVSENVDTSSVVTQTWLLSSLVVSSMPELNPNSMQASAPVPPSDMLSNAEADQVISAVFMSLYVSRTSVSVETSVVPSPTESFKEVWFVSDKMSTPVLNHDSSTSVLPQITTSSEFNATLLAPSFLDSSVQTPGLFPTRLPDFSSLSEFSVNISETPGMFPTRLPDYSSIDESTVNVSQTPGLFPTRLPDYSSMDESTVNVSETPGLFPTRLPDYLSMDESTVNVSQTPGLFPTRLPDYSSLDESTVNVSQTPSLLPDYSSLDESTVNVSQRPDLFPTTLPDSTPFRESTVNVSQIPDLFPTTLPDSTPIGESTVNVSQTPDLFPTTLPDSTPIGQSTVNVSQTPDLFLTTLPDSTFLGESTVNISQTSDLFPTTLIPNFTSMGESTVNVSWAPDMLLTSLPDTSSLGHSTVTVSETPTLFPTRLPDFSSMGESTVNMSQTPNVFSTLTDTLTSDESSVIVSPVQVSATDPGLVLSTLSTNVSVPDESQVFPILSVTTVNQSLQMSPTEDFTWMTSAYQMSMMSTQMLTNLESEFVSTVAVSSQSSESVISATLTADMSRTQVYESVVPGSASALFPSSSRVRSDSADLLPSGTLLLPSTDFSMAFPVFPAESSLYMSTGSEFVSATETLETSQPTEMFNSSGIMETSDPSLVTETVATEEPVSKAILKTTAFSLEVIETSLSTAPASSLFTETIETIPLSSVITKTTFVTETKFVTEVVSAEVTEITSDTVPLSTMLMPSKTAVETTDASSVIMSSTETTLISDVTSEAIIETRPLSEVIESTVDIATSVIGSESSVYTEPVSEVVSEPSVNTVPIATEVIESTLEITSVSEMISETMLDTVTLSSREIETLTRTSEPISMLTSVSSVGTSLLSSVFTETEEISPIVTSSVSSDIVSPTSLVPEVTSSSVTSSSNLPAVTTPTVETTLNMSEALKHVWVVTVIKVPRSEDVGTKSFEDKMESRLAVTYRQAFNRAEQIQNGTYVPLRRRRKRYMQAGDVQLQMINVERADTGSNVDLVYYMEKAGETVPAETAVSALRLFSDQELALQLGYVVETNAKEFVPVPMPVQESPQYWIIGAVLGSVAGAVLILWCTLCIYFRCCRSPPIKDVEDEGEPHLVGLKDKDFEASHPEANYVHEMIEKARSNGMARQKAAVNRMENADPVYAQPRKPKKRPQASKPSRQGPYAEEEEEGSMLEDSTQYVSDGEENSSKTRVHPPKRKPRTRRRSPGERMRESAEVDEMPSDQSTRTSIRYLKMAPLERPLVSSLNGRLPNETDSDLQRKLELDRRKNKQRQREKRRNSSRSKDRPGHLPGERTDDLTVISTSSREPAPNMQGFVNGAYSESEPEADRHPQETLDQARQRMHKLLDDAFSLVTPVVQANQQNKISPQLEPLGAGVNTQDSRTRPKPVGRPKPQARRRPSAEDELQELKKHFNQNHTSPPPKPTPRKSTEKKHTPLIIDPGKRLKEANKLSWNPYRAGDETADLGLPQEEEIKPTTASSSPFLGRFQTTTFKEKTPVSSTGNLGSMENRYPQGVMTTEEPQPIIITTRRDAWSDKHYADSPISEKYEFLPKDTSTLASSPRSTAPQITSKYAAMMHDLDTDSMERKPSPRSRRESHESHNGGIEMESLGSGGWKSKSRQTERRDELDVVKDSVSLGKSPEPLIRSIREELMRLSSGSPSKDVSSC